MALSNLSRWLLGLAILVAGAMMLFGRFEEPRNYGDANLPIAPEEIPPPPANLPIKPVNAKTRICMADMACMREFFLKVTLGNDYQPRGSVDPLINKWQTPLNYRVYGWDQLDQKQSDAMKQGLADMTKVASTVGLGLGPDRRGINVVVLLTDDLEADLQGPYSELADKVFQQVPGVTESMIALRRSSPICGGLLSAESDGTLGFVRMYLSPTIDHWVLKRCVYEEFSQMLGLYADVADDIDSLYTDQAHRRQLTEFDFLLLRLLYHPLIEPGMDREQITSVFPDVYREVIEKPAVLPIGIQYH